MQVRTLSNVVRSLVLAGGLVALGAPSAQAEAAFSFEVTAFKQSIAEAVGDREGLAAFYRARSFEPIWTGTGSKDRARREALFEAIAMASDHGLPEQRYQASRLMTRMGSVQGGRALGQLELDLSRTFLQFAHDMQSGVLDDLQRIDSGLKRTQPRRDETELLTRIAQEDPRMVFRSLIPDSPEYTRLLTAKLRLEHKIAHGGWGKTVPAGSLEPGAAGNAVVALRDRLVAMGYLQPHIGTVYDSRMQAAVTAFQQDHNLEADGVAGTSTMKAINTAPEERLKSIMVAMERERWLNLPEGRGKRHVLVNLVDFHAQIIDDNKLTFETRSVIGHQDLDRRTPEFSDVMEHMVINPYWYVPRSIVVGEYLPLLRANPGAVGHLQIIDSRGRVVGRRDFSQYSARSFPFGMRQQPGPRNALGSVKFMFPNKHNIYLHDTPSQHLFAREVRTYSHGCIRLDDPHEFAYALLAAQMDEPEAYFQRVLRSGANTKVPLETQVPVHLIYRTAFTQAKGAMNYRNDVYGRDAKIWRALATAGVALRTGRS